MQSKPQYEPFQTILMHHSQIIIKRWEQQWCLAWISSRSDQVRLALWADSESPSVWDIISQCYDFMISQCATDRLTTFVDKNLGSMVSTPLRVLHCDAVLHEDRTSFQDANKKRRKPPKETAETATPGVRVVRVESTATKSVTIVTIVSIGTAPSPWFFLRPST